MSSLSMPAFYPDFGLPHSAFGIRHYQRQKILNVVTRTT
jgi:hypothetical protein